MDYAIRSYSLLLLIDLVLLLSLCICRCLHRILSTRWVRIVGLYGLCYSQLFPSATHRLSVIAFSLHMFVFDRMLSTRWVRIVGLYGLCYSLILID